jgi:hypothetical protein
MELAAFYVAGVIGLFVLLKTGMVDGERRGQFRVLALLTFASLLTAWLLRSVVGDNNDLGWRAVLPAAMLLIVFSAAAISHGWKQSSGRFCAIVAAAGVLLSTPETVKLLNENLFGLRKPSEQPFAMTPAIWDAVRRHTAPGERVANNPRWLADMTPWPVNISWALLADRRSCWAGAELAIPFAPISAARRAEIEAQFVRVFAGDPVANDVSGLASRFRCDVVLVTPQDGAWQRDAFAPSGVYRLVEQKVDAWRIYRRAAAP